LGLYRILKRVLNINLETTRLRGRPRNRWQDEVREDGRIVGGEEWQKKVYNREEWKKLLRTARNCCILHMPVKRMNECMWYINNTVNIREVCQAYTLLGMKHRQQNKTIMRDTNESCG
jgi:hypothetical protein